MAFFKFRKPTDEQSAAPAATESVDAMRKRAKYRLIGAAVLVLAGVIGFPFMFDQQPRPIAVDMPIDIPDRNKVTALSIPAPAATRTDQPAAPDKATAAPTASITVPLPPARTATQEKPLASVEGSTEKAVEAPVRPDIKLADKSVSSPPPVPQPAAGRNEAAKAQALLEGRDPAKDDSVTASRYVVQVGAFADPVRAREVRSKMEKAGLKTYTHVAETKEGPRTRVRVGPFATKAEADQAADKIKKLDLPAAVLTL